MEMEVIVLQYPYIHTSTGHSMSDSGSEIKINQPRKRMEIQYRDPTRIKKRYNMLTISFLVYTSLPWAIIPSSCLRSESLDFVWYGRRRLVSPPGGAS